MCKNRGLLNNQLVYFLSQKYVTKKHLSVAIVIMNHGKLKSNEKIHQRTGDLDTENI